MQFQFESLSDFFWMTIEGRVHGPYVWAAYAITLGGIGAIAANLRIARNSFFKKHAAILRRGVDMKGRESKGGVLDSTQSVDEPV